MKKIIGILALGLITMAFVVKSESSKEKEGEGIKFKSLSLEKAKAEALENDQLIFIDAHTSWCGPCKKMAATSFKNVEVGELYNEKFINLKIDCELDADGPEISRLAEKERVNLIPLLLNKGENERGFLINSPHPNPLLVKERATRSEG
jgi:thiol-disulfide isomerase/thioredoxin